MNPRSIFRIVLSFFDLINYHFRENKQNIIITAFGMIFIVMIFTTTFTADMTLKMDYVDQQVSALGEIKLIGTSSGMLGTTTLETSWNAIDLVITAKTGDHDLNGSIKSDHLITIGLNCKALVPSTGGNFWPDPFVGSFNESLLEEISHSSFFSGRLPVTTHEVIYFGLSNWEVESQEEQWMELFQINNTIEITSRYGQSANLTVVGKYSTISPLPMQVSNPILISHGLYTSHGLFKQLSVFHGNYFSVFSQYSFSLVGKADYFTLEKVLDDVKDFANDVQLSMTGIHRFDGWSSSLKFFTFTDLDSVREQLAPMSVFSVLSMLPGLTIAFFIPYFVSSMFFRQYEKQIGLLRLRGIGVVQLSGLILLEGTLSAITSLVIGYGIGILLTLFLTGFGANFIFPLPVESAVLSFKAFNDIFAWSIAFIVIITAIRGLNLGRIGIRGFIKIETDLSSWIRIFFSVMLLVIGITGTMIYFDQVYDINSTMRQIELGGGRYSPYTDLGGSVNPVHLFNVFLFTPFPIFLLLGGIMTLSIIIIPVLEFISARAWHRFGNLFSYTLLNVARKRLPVTRAVLLLSLVFSLLWVMCSAPVILQDNITRESYYSTGADCYYSQKAKDTWDPVLEEVIASDPNIDDFIRTGTIRLKKTQSYSLISSIIFPGFQDIAYLEEDFCNGENIDMLLSSELTVLVNEKYQDVFKKGTGDTIPFVDNNGTAMPLTIIGTFNYWPRLMMEPASWNRAQPKAVITNKTFTALVNAGAIDSNDIKTLEQGYYFRLSSSADLDEMRELYGDLGLHFARDAYQEVDESILLQLLRLHLKILYVLAIVTVFVVIVFQGYSQLQERSRELLVERAIGMKTSHFSRMFFYETFFNMGLGYVFGSLMGMVFTYPILSFWLLVLFPTAAPPPVIIFPWVTTNLLLGIIIITGLVASIVPAAFISKRTISASLRII